MTSRKAEIAEASASGQAASDGGAHSDLKQVERDVVYDRRVRGTEWGSVVHDALEAAARGIVDDALRRIARGLLVAAERPSDGDGEPLELDELLAMIAAVQRSEIWQRALRADVRLVEVPFGVRVDADTYARMAGAVVRTDAPAIEIIDGRMDLVFRDANGWAIVDYKSDPGGSRIPADLLERYRGQVRLYAHAWRELTGDDVAERVLLFTADGVAVPC